MVQLDEMIKVSLVLFICCFVFFVFHGNATFFFLCVFASFPRTMFIVLCTSLSRSLSRPFPLQEEPENVRLKEEVSELKVACSSSERRIRLLQDELEQARMMTQEFDRVQDHCAELEREVSETRGLLNDKDRKISEQALVRTNCENS